MNSASSIGQELQQYKQAFLSINQNFQSSNLPTDSGNRGGQSVSSSLKVEFSYMETSVLSARFGHKMLAKSLQAKFEGLQIEQAGAYSPESMQPPSAEEVANRVLGFVENRLKQEQANGATGERLDSLMQQARAGVEKGYAEAREMIDGMGLMTEALNANIQDSQDRIQTGLDGLQQKYVPVPSPEAKPSPEQQLIDQTAAAASKASEQAPAASQPQTAASSATPAKEDTAIKSSASQPAPSTSKSAQTQSSGSYQAANLAAKSEQIGIQVKTRDGDIVTISLKQLEASLSATSGKEGRYGFDAASLAGQYAAGDYSFDIQGELDDAEVQALDDLLGQIQGVADQFFKGDLGAAFQSAMNIGFNTDELASFSVSMTRTTLSYQTQAYRDVAGQGRAQGYGQGRGQALGNDALQALQEYTRSLLESLQQSSPFGDAAQLVGGLFDQMFGNAAQQHQLPQDQQDSFQDFTHRLLDRLATQLAPAEAKQPAAIQPEIADATQSGADNQKSS